jgi:serine/threonine-protein kinase PpkA
MTDLIGKTIGEYQLLELILNTPTTVVLKGFQPSLNRYVALEVLKPDVVQDAAVSQRFLQFGEIASRLQHPNLMTVYDSGREGSVVYRVMPLMPGGRLVDHLTSYRDPLSATALFKQIESALSFLHGQGYIHGHLTPENISFDENRNPVLSEYGFSQSPGEALTPYQSPEQVQGGIIDKRSDIYASGVLLYTLLAGQAPLPGVVVSLRAVRPDLPQELEMLILKAMAQNPDQRYQTASEFYSALETILRAPVAPQQPVQASAPTPYAAPPPPTAKKGPNWLVIALGGILVVAMCLCAVLVVPKVMDSLAQPTDVAEAPEPLPTEPQPEIIPTQEPRPTRPPDEIPTEPAAPEPTQPLEQTPDQLPERTQQSPGEGSPGLPGICSSTGFIGGSLLFGFVSVSRKRKKRS